MFVDGRVFIFLLANGAEDDKSGNAKAERGENKAKYGPRGYPKGRKQVDIDAADTEKGNRLVKEAATYVSICICFGYGRGFLFVATLGAIRVPPVVTVKATQAGFAIIMAAALSANPAFRAGASPAVGAVAAIGAEAGSAVGANPAGLPAAVALGAGAVVFDAAIAAVTAIRKP